MKKWDVHRKFGMYGGVGEMALLHLWVSSLPEGEYLNLLKDDADHGVFDNSVGESSGYLEHQYEYIKRLSVKNLHWEDGRPYCYTIDGKNLVFKSSLCRHYKNLYGRCL